MAVTVNATAIPRPNFMRVPSRDMRSLRDTLSHLYGAGVVGRRDAAWPHRELGMTPAFVVLQPYYRHGQIALSEVTTMKMIRTVTGDVPADKMGRTLTHEHLLYTYPGGEYDHNSSFELDKAVDRIATELKAGMDEFHYGTIVDMTPAEVGRHPELMKRVSQKTGANVIAVSGFFPERMGIPYWFRRQTVEELADFYIRD